MRNRNCDSGGFSTDNRRDFCGSSMTVLRTEAVTSVARLKSISKNSKLGKEKVDYGMRFAGCVKGHGIFTANNESSDKEPYKLYTRCRKFKASAGKIVLDHNQMSKSCLF